MSLTLEEKIELVSCRYDVEEICDALEITVDQLLEVFGPELDARWHKFSDIETDIEDALDRKSTRLKSSHVALSRMPSSA